MTNNKRVLLLYHMNFLKKDAGNNAYTFNIIKALKSQGYTIDFLSANYFDDYSEVESLNKANNNLLDNIFLYKGKQKKYKHNYSSFTWVNDGLLHLFQKVISQAHYDFIYVHYVNFLDYIKFSKINPNTKVILTIHDFEALQIFYSSKSLDNFGRNIEEEIRLLDYTDEILCISNDELAFLSRFFPNRKFRLLPHFMEKKQIPQRNKNIDCLFIGHSNHCNMNAVKWFIDNVYPHLNKDINITICGKVCEMIKNKVPEYYQKMKDYNFNIIDFADDLDELYAQTRIAIVPMLEGTGLKIKTITAMAYGLPIVAMPLGVDGFPDKTQNGCLITANGKEFANHIENLISNENYYNTVKQNISEYFDNNFSEEKGNQILSETFKIDTSYDYTQRAKYKKNKLQKLIALKNKLASKCLFSITEENREDKIYKIVKILGIKIKLRKKTRQPQEQPKVTIITSTYNLINANREISFRRCVESIHNQTYKNIEHIVIDGASNDGTLELIKEYADKGWLTYNTEKDKGIYDAMNKGIKIAKGKYINFMNSDDSFRTTTAVEKSIKLLEENNADYSYAYSNVLDEEGNFLWVYYPQIEKAHALMPFNHQTMFTKTDVLKKENCFDLNFSSAADYDLILRLIIKKYKGVELKETIVNYCSAGESSINKKKSIEEQLKLFKKNYSKYINFKEKNYEKMLIERFVPYKLLIKLWVTDLNYYLNTYRCYKHSPKKTISLEEYYRINNI